MNLLPAPLRKEYFQYYSPKPIDKLKEDIQGVLDSAKAWNASVNLQGSFTGRYEFSLTPKFQMMHIRNFERKVAYIHGKLRPDDTNSTIVDFSVRPNSIFTIFFVVFPCIGILGFIKNIGPEDTTDLLILCGLLMFVFPLFFVGMSYVAKQDVKNRFVDTFRLKPILTIKN
jgi:hypothetical protein